MFKNFIKILPCLCLLIAIVRSYPVDETKNESKITASEAVVKFEFLTPQIIAEAEAKKPGETEPKITSLSADVNVEIPSPSAQIVNVEIPATQQIVGETSVVQVDPAAEDSSIPSKIFGIFLNLGKPISGSAASTFNIQFPNFQWPSFPKPGGSIQIQFNKPGFVAPAPVVVVEDEDEVEDEDPCDPCGGAP